MYEIAKNVMNGDNGDNDNDDDSSNSASAVFARNFIPEECLNFALAYTMMSEDDDDPPSND